MLFIRRDRSRRAVLRALRRLERERSRVRVEIENVGISFVSTLTVVREMVLIPRPPDIRRHIPVGGMVRCRLPWDRDKYLRMEIVTAQYKLPWKTFHVIICNWPEEILGQAPRRHDRFNTSRYKNIRLVLPGIEQPLRVIDISEGGCKVLLPAGLPDDAIRPGGNLGFGRITLGTRVAIELENLIPRVVRRGDNVVTVGLEMFVEEDGPSHQNLRRLLASIEHRETSRVVPQNI